MKNKISKNKKVAITLSALTMTCILNTMCIPHVAYAQNQSILGDVNGDGKIDSIDLEYIKYMSSIDLKDSSNKYWINMMNKADMNGDGQVTEKDITLLENFMKNKEGDKYKEDKSKEDIKKNNLQNFGNKNITKNQKEILNKWKNNCKSEEKISINWDKKSNSPSFINGDLYNKPIKNNKEAETFLNENKALFNIEHGNFKVDKVEEDDKNKKHYRTEVTIDNLPVYGSDLIIHTDKSGTVYAINGKSQRGIENINWNKKVKVSKEQSIKYAEKALDFKINEKSFEEKPKSQLYIYKFKDKTYVAYVVELMCSSPKVTNMKVFVNAENGEIIDKYEQSFTNIFNGQATKGKGTDIEGKNINIDTTLSNGTYYLAKKKQLGTNISVYDLQNSDNYYDNGELVEDTDNNFNSDSQKAAVSAYENGSRVYDYFLSEFNRNSIDGRGMDINLGVHLGTNLNNAFWSGTRMIFGDGDGVQFSPLSGSLDVTGHEMTHGITQYTSGLEYRDQSGALNEAISDILGVACEAYYDKDEKDWLLGEDCYTPEIHGDGLRDMAMPEKYNQPEHMRDYMYVGYDNGGVHYNSGIINKAAYNIGSVLGKREMGKLFYRANTTYLTRTSNFDDMRNATLSAAQEFYGEDSKIYKVVMNAFADVGIGERSEDRVEDRKELQDTYEPNNGFNEARDIEIGKVYNGVISNKNDADYFFIDAKDQGEIKVSLTDLPEDYEAYVYDSRGNEIGLTTEQGKINKAVSCEINEKGRVFVKVTSANGTFTPYEYYNLKVDYLASEKEEQPNKDSNTEDKENEKDNKEKDKDNKEKDKDNKEKDKDNKEKDKDNKEKEKDEQNKDNSERNKNNNNNNKQHIGWNYDNEIIESEHPYKNNSNDTKVIYKKGAESIVLYFEKIQLKSDEDNIYVKDKDGKIIKTITKEMDGLALILNGDTAYVNFVSGNQGNAYGYKINNIGYYLDKVQEDNRNDEKQKEEEKSRKEEEKRKQEEKNRIEKEKRRTEEEKKRTKAEEKRKKQENSKLEKEKRRAEKEKKRKEEEERKKSNRKNKQQVENGWNYYKKLIESKHDYPNNCNLTKTFSRNGAQTIALYFGKIDLQSGHDFIYVKDKKGNLVTTITGHKEGMLVIVNGDTACINLVSDKDTSAYGYEIYQIAYYMP